MRLPWVLEGDLFVELRDKFRRARRDGGGGDEQEDEEGAGHDGSLGGVPPL